MPVEIWLETLRVPAGGGETEVAVAGVMYSLSVLDSVLVNKEDAMLSED
jgi:hypothetical protein